MKKLLWLLWLHHWLKQRKHPIEVGSSDDLYKLLESKGVTFTEEEER